MPQSVQPYAALILPDGAGLDAVPYLKASRAVLARIDPHPEHGARIIRRLQATVGQSLGLRCLLEAEGAHGPRVRLEVIGRGGRIEDGERATQLLSEAVQECLSVSPARRLEWNEPGLLIDREDFLRLRRMVADSREACAQAPATPGAAPLTAPRAVAPFPPRDASGDPAPVQLSNPVPNQVSGAPLTADDPRATEATSTARLAGMLALRFLRGLLWLTMLLLRRLFTALRAMTLRAASQTVSLTVLLVALAQSGAFSWLMTSLSP